MARRGCPVSRTSAVAIAIAIVLAGCGDPTADLGSEAPGSEAPASETPATTTQVDTDESSDDDNSAASDDSIAPATEATTDPGLAPPTSQPLGGVTIDDPFPAQADGATDPAVADAAIRWAYQHWILVDLDPAVRARLIEDGELNSDRIEAGIAEARPVIEFGRLAVDEVRITGMASADVVFRAEWQGGPSPYFPDPMTGTALFRDGSWRISGDSLCLLAFGTGQDCARTIDDLPVAPAGFRVTNVPADLVWGADPAYVDLVAIPGWGYWTAQTPPSTASPSEDTEYLRQLNISTDILAGASALSDADADTVLASGRFGLADGTPLSLGGARGRLAQRGTTTQIVVIRDDDVLVSAFANGLTRDELIAVVLSLVPTDLPPGYTLPSG